MSLRSIWERFPPSIKYILRSPWLWIALLTIALALGVGTNWLLQARAAISPVPADLFMQSVVRRDGDLGWHQLCPQLQAQESLSQLSSAVRQQHEAESKQGLRLSLDYIGAHPRPQGGQIRLYILTARLPGGWIGQRTYIVYTRSSGCVEDVQNT